MSQEESLSRGYGRAPGVLPAAAVDVSCVLLFAIVGRSSHAEANTLAGVLLVGWRAALRLVPGLRTKGRAVG